MNTLDIFGLQLAAFVDIETKAVCVGAHGHMHILTYAYFVGDLSLDFTHVLGPTNQINTELNPSN